MTTFFVTRHPGAVEWAERHDLKVDRWVEHLDSAAVAAGDIVIGTLPVHVAAEVCARGARYLHLVVDVPASHRGRELSADELERFGADLRGYRVLAEDGV